MTVCTASYHGLRQTPRGLKALTVLNMVIAEASGDATLTQGSCSTAVAASGGTHSGGDAGDLTKFNWYEREKAGRLIGFNIHHRLAIKNVWAEHVHWTLLGSTTASKAAKNQNTNWESVRGNGLANHGRATGYIPSVNIHFGGIDQHANVALRDTQGYSEPNKTARFAKTGMARAKGWTFENLYWVTVNGKEWLATSHQTFYDAADFTRKVATPTPPPAVEPVVDPKRVAFSSSVFQQNANSRGPGWVKRSSIIARQALASDASFLTFEELYAERRPMLSAKIRSKYTLAVAVKGKAIYVRNGRWNVAKGSTRTYDLGNGKNAAALKAKHVDGHDLNVVAAHTSWEHKDSAKRYAETKLLIKFVTRDFPTDPTVWAGDWNDSTPTGDRAYDATLKAFKEADIHDLYNDVDNPVNAKFNSSNQYLANPPQQGIHLDRVWGKNIEGTKWVLVVGEPKPADHYAVFMEFDVLEVAA